MCACKLPGSEMVTVPAAVSHSQKFYIEWIIMVLFFRSVLKEIVENYLADVLTITCSSVFTLFSCGEIFFLNFSFFHVLLYCQTCK